MNITQEQFDNIFREIMLRNEGQRLTPEMMQGLHISLAQEMKATEQQNVKEQAHENAK